MDRTGHGSPTCRRLIGAADSTYAEEGCMGLINRPVRVGVVAVIGLAISAYTGAMASGALAAPATSGPQLVAIRGSVSPTTDAITGGYHSARMSIEVALAPRNAAGLARSIKAIYTKHSGSYHKWLGTGR